jgi:bacterial/archaeal transporter family-2 protein
LTPLAVALAVLAGLAGSVQVAVMGRFGGRVGVFEALSFSTAVQLAFSLLLLLVARGGLGGLHHVFRTPAWMWIGGLMGALVVFTITLAGPRIGTTATVAVFLVGQFAAAAVVDRYGLFGLERIAVGWPRVVGLVLLGVGAALTLKK